MSTPADPRREFGGTYFVQDQENVEELTRVQILDHLTTTCMGGVLPEQPDPTRFRRVLDIGCGTGGWLIEVARTYPGIERLVGIDVSRRMIAYARKEAETQQVSSRMEFRLMDALQMLEFPNDFFDLVNHRLAVSWLRTWEWPKLLQEYRRVCHPDGVIRITEGDWIIEGSSPALTRLSELLHQAGYQAGHLFTLDKNGITNALAPLLHQHGLEQVQTHVSLIEYRASTVEGQHFIEGTSLAFRTVVPFLRKWTRVPDDYEDIYQQALREMHQLDFVARGDLLTVWGKKP